jgi:hypothetical protein
MKNFYLIFFLFPFICNSQNEEPLARTKYRGFLTFGIGSAIPAGDLAMQNAGDSRAGLAKGGLDLRLHFGYQVHDHVGLCLTYYGQAFRINAQAAADYYARQSPGTTNTVIVTRGWTLGGILGGLYFRLPVGEGGKCFLEPRVMLGVSTAKSPEFSVTTTYNYYPTSGGTYSGKAETSSGESQLMGCYDIGTSLKFELGNRFCLSFSVDYLGCFNDAYFEQVPTLYSTSGGPFGNISTTQHNNSTQEMKSFTFSLGLGIRFGKKKTA